MSDFFKPKPAASFATPPRLNWPMDIGILVGSAILLAVAYWLEPTADGSGTTIQLLPTCPFRRLTGLPCGSCGLTRCFVFAVRGEFGRAWRIQPFGFLLFWLMVGSMVDAAVSLATGRSLRDADLPWRWMAIGLAFLYFAAWGYVLVSN